MATSLEKAQQASDALKRFLETAREPVVVEPGGEPIPLVTGAYHLEHTGGRLMLQAWNRNRSLSRCITEIVREKTGLIEFAVERFGKRSGTLEIFDTAQPKSESLTRKASRRSYREQFRRSLSRQFPGWRIAELSTEPDLEHSLSPAYPRALLTKGAVARAAIGCAPEAHDVDGVLTFGLIWLDYLRQRDKTHLITGLTVFVPQGKHRSICLRLLHLKSPGTEWSVYAYTDRMEERLDLQDYGNIDTELPVREGPAESERAWWAQRLSLAPYVSEREEAGGRVSWTVCGLGFARWQPGEGLTFGIETKHSGHESNLPEIEALARELARFRTAGAAGASNPLYLKKPELWLEERVRSALREIDASLEPAPVYRQAPAFAAGERSVLDLLAVDHAGGLVVVEVKASEDLHLPLQALDYWIRVRWHAGRNDFAAAGYFPGRALRTIPPRLLLVAPALSFHPSNDIVLRYFSPEVRVDMIGLSMDWRREIKVMFRKDRAARPS